MAKAPTKPTGKRKLTIEQQHFLVTRLACYTTVRDVQEEFLAEYDEPIDRNLVGRYDPTKRYTTSLGKNLVELFNATRKNYEAGLLDMHPISKRVYRIDKLGKMFERAYDSKNMPLAAQFLKQAAEEVGELASHKDKARRYSQGDRLPPDSPDAPAEAGYDGGDVELGSLRQMLVDVLTDVMPPASASKH